MDFIIRQVKQDDTTELLSFFREVITDTFAKEGVADLIDDIEIEVKDKSDKLLKSFDPNSLFQFFVAEKDGGIIGTLSVNEPGQFSREHLKEKVEGVLEIGSVFVKPECQSRGVGKRLLCHAIEYLRSSGYKSFALDSGYFNAQKIWGHILGKPEVILENFWGNGVDHMFWLKEI